MKDLTFWGMRESVEWGWDGVLKFVGKGSVLIGVTEMIQFDTKT